MPGDCYLHLYAADLIRTSDGTWRVVADRANAPSGVGYALENRIVFARMFPGMIRDCRIERLAPFFIALQKTLREFAPQHRDNPRVVLLSEGSQSSRHFEDAYLARYLNYTLAEVGDLAVRHGYVTLKTLGGLLPVDVVFRRLSDTLCDPLEFQGDAALGVPGLLQAVRPAMWRWSMRWVAPPSRRLRCCRFCPTCVGGCCRRNCGCRRWKRGGPARRRAASGCSPDSRT